jgi:hypothetical protein
MNETRGFLQSIGLPPGDLHSLPTSSKRFPDGARYRIEIPSTEGPRCLEAVLEEAERLRVPVQRVSQGSGAFLLTEDELDDMARIAAGARIEVSMFAQPFAAWVNSATAKSPAGGAVGGASHGQEGVVFGLEDIKRSARHGFRSVLIADLGLLDVFDQARRAGELPADMQAKVSVVFPVANPATARVLVEHGANTLNVMTDLTLPQLAAIRDAVDVPIDFYVEAPDSMGGFVRLYEVAEIIRVAAPVYVKLGLANAPGLYPAGSHIEHTAVALSRERVRRARIALELLASSGFEAATSEPGAAGLAIPVPAGVGVHQ